MKKIIALAIAVLMLATLAVPAFAQDVTVTYEVEGEYSVTIPADITLDPEQAVTLNVAASGMLAIGQTLTVAVSSENYNEGWFVKSGNVVLEYSIKNGEDDVANNATVLTWDAEDTAPSVDLSLAVVDEGTQIGIYTDTLTFAVEVE